MKLKKNITFIFFIVAGIIVGALIATLASEISFLSWLAFGKTIGLSTQNPLLINLLMIKLAFGFEVELNIAQIITITAALLLYKKVAQKL